MTEQFDVEPAVHSFGCWHCCRLGDDEKCRQHKLLSNKDKCLCLWQLYVAEQTFQKIRELK